MEEFLLPPLQGLDWRWPPHPVMTNYYTFSETPEIVGLADLYTRIGYHTRPDQDDDNDNDDEHYSKRRNNEMHPVLRLPRIASIRYQAGGHGVNQYNALRTNNETEATYDQVFRDCWYSVFAPSEPVQHLINQSMKSLNLQRDQYHSIHVRAQYHSMSKNGRYRYQSQNSVNCLVKFLQTSRIPINAETPVFVATDLLFSSRAAVIHARAHGLKRAVTRVSLNSSWEHDDKDEPILHLDRGRSFVTKQVEKWTRHDVSRYYDTFVDLYLLSFSKCIILNVGVRPHMTVVVASKVFPQVPNSL